MVKWVFFYSWVMPWWVMPWWVIGLCRGFYFCGCRLIFLGSCELILVVVVVEELVVGNGSGVGCMKWWWQWWDVLFYCSKYIILL